MGEMPDAFGRTSDSAVFLVRHGLEARATTARMAVPREGHATTARPHGPRRKASLTGLAGMAVPRRHFTRVNTYPDESGLAMTTGSIMFDRVTVGLCS